MMLEKASSAKDHSSAATVCRGPQLEAYHRKVKSAKNCLKQSGTGHFFSGHVYPSFLCVKNIDLQPPSVTPQPPALTLQPPLLTL